MKKLLFALSFSASAVPAAAGVVTFSDRAAFNSAAGAVTTLDFEGQAPAGFYSSWANSHDFGPFTASATNVYVMSGTFQAPNRTLGTGDALYLIGTVSNVTLSFDTPLYALGFDLGSYFSSAQLTLSVAGQNYDLTTSPSIAVGQFFGVVSDVAFSTLVFSSSTNAYQIAPKIDNLSYSSSVNVPEPAMLGLFGIGALGLGLSRRRRAA